MRVKSALVAAVAAAASSVAAPAMAGPVIPWGEEITVVPGACVTHPCPFPITVTVPDNPVPPS